jgi:hypothetical protein
MHVSTIRTATQVLLLCLWMVSAAAAEPVQVTGGRLDINRPRGELNLVGDRGFTLDAVVSTTSGVWGPELSWCASIGCEGGSTVPLSSLWSGMDIRSATASLDGWSGALMGMDGPSAHVEFHAGTLVLPTVGLQPLTLVAPFTFSGLLILQSVDMGRAELVGNGWAAVWLTPTHMAGMPPLWRISQMRYDFSPDPIPEPTTLVLLGGAGLALAARRLRSRRHAQGVRNASSE